ncbi:hypothetical protein BJX64DRAFT_57521 [Aspergillus heterothallicus]
METFAAIGLVGNIVTFVDFGLRIVSKARRIRQTAAGATAENERITSMTVRFRIVVEGLQKQHATCNVVDAAFTEVAAECLSLAQELQDLLGQLKARKPNSKLSSFKAALSDWRHADEKHDLEARLIHCREELEFLMASRTRFDFYRRLESIAKNGESTQSQLTSLHDNISALRWAVEAENITPTIKDKLNKLLQLSETATLKVQESRLLKGLRFNRVNERFDDVAKAHIRTFDWIFEDTRKAPGNSSQREPPRIGELPGTLEETSELTNAREAFVNWLQQGGGMFHISGKPGSGKSTLMKYICDHPQTEKMLRVWSKTKTLVIAKFFFWKPGKPLQKTMKGLVRGLLYDILKQAPELIPKVLPKHWESVLSDPNVVFDSSEELSQAFRALTEGDTHLTHKFALFIDGLDEFEGNHVEMVTFLSEWTACKSEDVKICVSSREWLVFQDLLKDAAKFQLHQLTRHDISNLVDDTLSMHSSFINAQCTLVLRNDIVRKSEGVFLWVKHILEDIKEGMRSEDDV